jgi:hypothetical protein
VLAALVPERVLPFASGGSRKRGLSRAEGSKPRMPRWGAERRARPLHFLRSRRPRSSHSGRRGDRVRAACFDAAPGWCASRRSASLLLREDFLECFLGFAFLGVTKLGCEEASRERKDSPSPGHSRSKNGVASLAYAPAIHGASQNAHWSKLHSAIQHGPPGHLSPRRRFAPFARW